jgi:hypothetical protein
MKPYLMAALSVALLLYACGSKEKEGQGRLLDEKKMQAVLWDVLQAGAFTQNFVAKDSTLDDSVENAALQKKIFGLHKITREDFYYSYNYYSLKPHAMKKILDSIVAAAGREKDKIMIERYGGSKQKLEKE